ncbi:hypothetical protein, partial [Cryobacterium sp. TMS1-20-1]|uniref:hypothetical protein n=1 Tax=Cryobacterium sp. TMS1-20-1 TaxID=1259223 RepID=UPI00141B332A
RWGSTTPVVGLNDTNHASEHWGSLAPKVVPIEANIHMTDPRDITADACATNDACIAAVRSEEISIYRFASPNDAEKFAETLGDNGHQSDWIVLEYPGAKFDSDPTKSSYAGLIDSMWTSD